MPIPGRIHCCRDAVGFGTFTYADDVVAHIASRCKEVDSGARNVESIITGTLLPELSTEFLARMAAGEPIKKAEASEESTFRQATY